MTRPNILKFKKLKIRRLIFLELYVLFYYHFYNLALKIVLNFPTDPLTILEPQNPRIYGAYKAQRQILKFQNWERARRENNLVQ